MLLHEAYCFKQHKMWIQTVNVASCVSANPHAYTVDLFQNKVMICFITP